ncbi:MAG: hypothetical protein ACFNZJ_03335 [Parascardovia denticolens]|nr:hypothetical protein [Parascardovia denticolens]
MISPFLLSLHPGLHGWFENLSLLDWGLIGSFDRLAGQSETGQVN